MAQLGFQTESVLISEPQIFIAVLSLESKSSSFKKRKIDNTY